MREIKGKDTSMLSEKHERFRDHRPHQLCIMTIILSSVMSAEVVYLLPRHSCPLSFP